MPGACPLAVSWPAPRSVLCTEAMRQQIDAVEDVDERGAKR